MPKHQTNTAMKRARDGLGMTQLELARLVGVAVTTISGIETRHRQPGLSLAARLALVLNMQESDFLMSAGTQRTNSGED